MIRREISKSYTPKTEQGFLGAGHMARSVVVGGFEATDPFIFLMDDMLDKKDDDPAGGPHPHAGFETVSLMIDGEIKEMLESMKEGDFQIMTAGRGVVHTEPIVGPTKGRLLQMWLNLPKEFRAVAPRLQTLPAEHVPVLNFPGVRMRLYSGTLSGISSPIQNYTPLIAAEIVLDAASIYTVEIPANFKAFIYVISGSVSIAELTVDGDQVAWLNTFVSEELSELTLHSGQNGLRLVLYAAKPTGDDIVSHGPFIADSSEDISSLYGQYKRGLMKHISTESAEHRITY